MTRSRRPGPAPIPRRTADALSAAQDRITVRIMLRQGGVVTPIGQKAIIRIPTGAAATFPLALVEEIQGELRNER